MKKIIKSIFQYVGAILLAIVIAALLRFFIVDFYSIPSDSMYPTIEPGDFIVVNKMYSPLLQKLRLLGRRTPGNRTGTGVLFTETQ